MPQSEGDVIGDRYRLVEKIGEGGMATVWEAEHVALGSRVAVKFLHRTAPQNSELAQRFLREARVAASVKHRNVVEINDFGFTEDEVPYMVMERLVGESLADFLHQRGPLPFADATRLASLTLRGLTAVHSAGIVHRDLKPDNVFLVHDEDGVFPKLLDFGLSRRIGRTDMTMEGTLMGTPDYMSPEQARGHTDLDARTDIYSMGVIVYEMIAARMPYESELIGDLIAMIARDPATPVTKYRPDAPPELVQVIERAMAKRREERFPDARAMRKALTDVWNELANANSDITNFSEFPHAALEDTGTDLLAQRTPTGRRPSPRFSRGGKQTLDEEDGDRREDRGAPLAYARTTPSVLGTADANDPTVTERVGFAGAPTLLASAISTASNNPAPSRTSPPRSMLSSLFALTLAAAAGATFAGVWIANGDNDEALSSFGEPSMVSPGANEVSDGGTGADADADDDVSTLAAGGATAEVDAGTAPTPSSSDSSATPTQVERVAAGRPHQVQRSTQVERNSKRRPAKRPRQTVRRSTTKRRVTSRRR